MRLQEMINAHVKWSEDEIVRLIYLTKTHRTSVIKWDVVVKQLNGRTLQQCKSFYNNFVKQYQLNHLLQSSQIQDLAKKVMSFLICGNINDFQHAAQKVSYEFALVDVILHLQMLKENNQSYKYNIGYLQLIREVIIVFNNSKVRLMEEIYVQQTAKLYGKRVTKEQFHHFTAMMNAFNSDDIFLKISSIVSNHLK
ncbi:SANT/Myb_domain [Hexamita inflata]|uniref:SANT/Myb domain n=1 Tax=Hexamita inflata TaxID=28002 RepID=A0AA86QPT8_9EUKA|nr:SANT/Myb domain [Hexamita inflata]CAI9963599.1 SANT/Myb domain [Hexamita inflata]